MAKIIILSLYIYRCIYVYSRPLGQVSPTLQARQYHNGRLRGGCSGVDRQRHWQAAGRGHGQLRLQRRPRACRAHDIYFNRVYLFASGQQSALVAPSQAVCSALGQAAGCRKTKRELLARSAQGVPSFWMSITCLS